MEEKETVALADTVPKMFWHGVQTRAGRVIYRQKELGIWKQVTWDELGRAARSLSRVSPRINFIARKARPSGSMPRSWIGGIDGCCRLAVIRASSAKRRTTPDVAL